MFHQQAANQLGLYLFSRVRENELVAGWEDVVAMGVAWGI